MGGSVGVNKQIERTSSFFVDERLLAGEKLMKLDKLARSDFVEFIKAGNWAENLSHLEDLSHSRSSNNSVWENFGYKSPHHSPCRSARTGNSFSEQKILVVEPDSVIGSIHHKLMLEECYNAISNSHLFKREELPAVLFAALLPIYLTRAEHDDSSEECSSKAKPSVHKRSERLHDWLLGAAAMFDGTQLELYLADPGSSWVEDYQRALSHLPLTIYLSSIDQKKQESKVVYCNTVKTSLIFGERSCIGENLHDLFSLQGSLHVAEQVETAIFDARMHKRSALDEYDSCMLRALKPVRNARGQHVYALGIESYPFVNPQLEESVVQDQPFQQIEDLLILLPMLIKMPHAAVEQ